MPQSATQTAVFPPPSASRRRVRRLLQIAFFSAAMVWFALADWLAARSARGLADRFNLDAARPLLSALFLLFLLAVGFGLLETVSGAGRMSLRGALGLPRRRSAGREWVLGAALGWGLAVAAVLPMALAGSLHVRFWTSGRAFSLLTVHLAALLVAALATEVALRGFAFRRLILAAGPTWATIILSLGVGLAYGIGAEATWVGVLATVLGSVLLCLGWLRTHGLWLPWGLHFAWNASVAALFGLPLRGVVGFASVVQTRALGREWLTGGEFGPEAALFSVLCALVGIVVLMKATDDFAWEYTRPEIVAAGYEVNPAPPAAHVAMEQETETRPAALVQILPTTPRSASANDG